MSVAGVSIKTLVLLVFVSVGGSWEWASATRTVPLERGRGYADTTVTIPGGFWFANFGAFFPAIMITVASRRDTRRPVLACGLDFGAFEMGVEAGAPKELEWCMAFSLMVTLIWLYITLLKLIALLTRNQ